MKYLLIVLLLSMSSLYAAKDNEVLNIIKMNFDNMEFEKVIVLSQETEKTPELQYYIAISYMYAKERTKDDKKTLELLNESSKNGYKPAKDYLASLYARGYIVNQDFKYSEQLYKEAENIEEADRLKSLASADFIHQPYKSYMNTIRFLQLSIRSNITKTKEYLHGTLKYRSKSDMYNTPIKKKNLDKIYNRLFNKKYKSLVLAEWEKSHNLFPSSFRLGYGPGQDTPSIIFGKYGKSIQIWFYDDGTPYVISNDLMVEASFNCNKAGNATEKAICDSYVLADLDKQLSNIYQDAKVYLTDDKYLNLKKEQRAFIKQRNRCKNDKICIEKIMKSRLNGLDTLIENEYSKDTSSIQNYEQKIDGIWKTKKFINAMSGVSGIDYKNNLKGLEIKKIVIKSPEVLLYDKNNKLLKTYTVVKTVFDTWAKVYERTAYKNHYAGSQGNMYLGKLPFAGHYISLSLGQNSAFLILSGQKLDKLFYSETQIDDIFVSDGLLLQK